MRETIERSKLSSTKRLVSIYRSLVYSITVLIVLISAVVVSVIVYIRTGRSIGDISDITSSTTALVAIVTTVYALATILLMAAGEKGGFRSFLMSVSKFIALLVGTSEYSQVMSKPERPAETGEAIEKSPHSIALSSSISPAARRRITERNIKLWRSQALQSNHNLIFDNIHDRLERFSGTILARSFFNLAVGVILAIFSLIILKDLVTAIGDVPVEKLTYHLIIPRVGLSLTSVLMAYFFLSLYKTGLQDIKYIHDELTSLELKRIALSDKISESAPLCQSDKELLLNSDRHIRGEECRGADSPSRDLVANISNLAAAIADAVKKAR